MSIFGEQTLLRIYLQSADRAPHAPTYERIVRAARKEQLAGATVLRGILGTGYHGTIQSSAWSLVQHVPVIVEIVDGGERIAWFIKEVLDKIMVGGMLTLERAAVILCHKGREDTPPAGDAADSLRPTPLHLASELKPLSTVPHIEYGAHMEINENGILLRVFIGESDQFDRKPLYEAIVQKVRELGLAGGTVLQGTEGFGANSVVHKAALLEMSTDLPIVIEVIDTEEKVRLLLPHLETMVQEGMITMEYVVILMYRHNGAHEVTAQPIG